VRENEKRAPNPKPGERTLPVRAQKKVKEEISREGGTGLQSLPRKGPKGKHKKRQ